MCASTCDCVPAVESGRTSGRVAEICPTPVFAQHGTAAVCAAVHLCRHKSSGEDCKTPKTLSFPSGWSLCVVVNVSNRAACVLLDV